MLWSSIKGIWVMWELKFQERLYIDTMLSVPGVTSGMNVRKEFVPLKYRVKWELLPHSYNFFMQKRAFSNFCRMME